MESFADDGRPLLRTVGVTRYITPLREGGSLPAIAEADDGFMYVLKFRGAGQGKKALIAELLGGEIARALGLRVPEIVFASLDEAFGRTEPDEEIQDLLKASIGLNLGLHYLAGSTTFDPAVTTVDPLLSSRIVWLDCLLTNVDRTARNTNMLLWHKELWLIDHGASLYFHHSWENWEQKATAPFGHVKDHVLLPQASELAAADASSRLLLSPERIRGIVSLIPDEWLGGDSPVGAVGALTVTGASATPGPFASITLHREAYYTFLTSRIAHSETFVKAAQHARQALI